MMPCPLPRKTVKELQQAERRIQGRAYVPAPKRERKLTWTKLRKALAR